MPEITEYKISDLTTAAQVDESDFVELSQADENVSGGRISLKATILAIANKIANGINFTSALQTTDKTIVGAINEVAQGGGGSDVEVTPILTEGTKIATITVDEVDADIYGENTKEELEKLSAEKTVTGNPVTLETVNGGVAKSCEVTMNPIQDLHGYDHPWAGGAGKNKCPTTVEIIKRANTSVIWDGNTTNIGGVDYTILTDESNNIIGIKANGTPNTSESTFYICTTNDLLSLLDYTGQAVYCNGCPSGGSENTYRLQFARLDGIHFVNDEGDGGGIYINDFSEVNVYVRISIKTQVNNLIFKPMIRLSGDSTFAPYENICPISGRDSVDVVVSDGETEITKTIAFPSTVYGGTDEVVGGVGQSNMGMVDLGTLDYTYNSANAYFQGIVPNIYVPSESSERNKGLISSQYRLAEGTSANTMTNGEMLRASGRVYLKNTDYTDAETFKTAMSGVQLCYELATPAPFSTEPTNIELQKGTNVISTHGDSVEIKYSEMMDIDDVKMLIDDAIGTVLDTEF